jgi:hypothetical protein
MHDATMMPLLYTSKIKQDCSRSLELDRMPELRRFRGGP